MRFCHSLDAVEVTFSDEHLVSNAGLVLPATLVQHLGLLGLFEDHLDLGGAPGRANVGDKAMTLIHSALLGGDSIDDADALRAGETQAVLGHVVLHRRLWAPFCGASPGVMFVSSTWCLDGYSRGHGLAERVPAPIRSRSMSTPRSTRPMADGAHVTLPRPAYSKSPPLSPR
jgi:hypothetical protein